MDAHPERGEIASAPALGFERYECVMPLAGFVHGPQYRAACGDCPHHGKNFSCPPYSPTFAEAAEASRAASVVCVRLALEPFAHLDAVGRYRACFRSARSLLVEELLARRAEGRRVLGSGACDACDPCAARVGESRCCKPEERIFSLESTGVDVADLVRACFGFELEWTRRESRPEFVCAVGAVFLDGPQDGVRSQGLLPECK